MDFCALPEAKRKPTTWGEYIWRAPANVVKPYAIGDVRRNRALDNFLRPKIFAAGMDAAYARELRLMLILIKMTKKGMPVDRVRLEHDMGLWQKEVHQLGELICKRLGYKYVTDNETLKALLKDRSIDEDRRSRFLNIDSDRALARALDSAGVMSGWLMTPPSKKFPQGQKKVSRDCLTKFMTDRKLFAMLEKRGQLSTYINTFAINWLEFSKFDGHLHVIWNGTRRPDDEGNMGGARTGRMSSSPNLQNVPKEPPEGLPWLRRYLLPERGQNLIVRDYSQQEFRAFAHYEDAAAKEAYLENPELDFHDMAGAQVNAILARSNVSDFIKLPLPRKPIKSLGFGILYGQGLALTATRMGVEEKFAKLIRDVYFEVLPGIQPLQKELKGAGQRNEPIRTWGGRLYYCEPPRYSEKYGRVMSFEYKLLNYLIQGSSADMTKEAMIRSDDAGLDIRLSVHDELAAMSAKRTTRRDMNLMREAMEGIAGWDVPLRSEGSWSAKSWGDLTKWLKDNRPAYKRPAVGLAA